MAAVVDVGLPTGLLLMFFVSLAEGHPQCLDYLPPFKSHRPLGLCKETSGYGCCSSSKEQYLMTTFNYVRKFRTLTRLPSVCEEFTRRILCAECHPYAAHIFDAETPPLIKTNFTKQHERFPGLCFGFCMDSFGYCREMIKQLPWRAKFRKYLEKAPVKEFCQWAVPADIDYCYPNVDQVQKSNVPTRKAGLKTMCVQPVTYGLSNPLVAISANDGTDRLFVGEQRGVIFAFDPKRPFKKPFLDIRNKILNSGQGWDERGFLGLAFHPKFSVNGRFFVYYSAANQEKKTNKTNESKKHWYDSPKHKIRISEFTISSSDPNVADADSEIILLEIDEPEANHEGGMLLFGDDGYLYMFPGDGGGAGDRHWSIGNALNMTSLLGKVLRVDVDVYDGRRYSIPKDNPFRNIANARPEIYAYGGRNMWRCSKDRGDRKTQAGKGRIFCGDVGQNKYEEIDIIVKGGNYGWRAMEGNYCYDKTLCVDKYMKNYQPPILVYNHTVGKSIVGGYVYRGCQNPNMQGLYFYADTVSGRIFAAKEDLKTRTWMSEEISMGNESVCNNAMKGDIPKHILSFGEDESGEIYMAGVNWPTASKPFGALYKLVDPLRRQDPEQCKFKSKLPKQLKNVRKRFINDSQRKDGRYKKQKICINKRKFCRYFKSFPWLCRKHKRLALLVCRKTCKYC